MKVHPCGRCSRPMPIGFERGRYCEACAGECARVSCRKPGITKVRMDQVQVSMCGEHADAELAPPQLDDAPGTRPVSMRHYSRALDEIYRLRTILAYEAQVTDAHHLGYKTFPKSRKRFVVEQAERMRRAARGDTFAVFSGISYPKQALSDAGAEQTLTRSAWEADENARSEVSSE